MTRKARPPRNPVSRPLALAAFTTLGVVGLSAVFGLGSVLQYTALPLGMLCSALLIAYTVWGLRLGWIATVGHVGQIYHYQRAQEPILFWFLVVFYLVPSVLATAYMVTLAFG